ncbi:mucin-2-like [Paramacrobiotus metropolitanus]|uniref:mucin-2-like n=1 Tax=Paramacrobiotus metropolitanus TaxID=2943436 RepID=UPI002445CEB5|nr:mucin-2-like [Paramacrobiotus metropolitanus]
MIISYDIPIVLSLLILSAFPFLRASTYEDFEPVWKRLLAKQNNSRLGYSKDLNQYGADRVQGYGSSYITPNSIQYLINGQPSSATTSTYPQTLSLVSSATGIIDSDVKCGTDNRNFCNYPALPFVETLNIPQLLASPNRLNRIPSGRCPDGYTKHPTKDCINIAPAVIEATCCVYDTPVVNLTDYCSNRQAIQFNATFELCDGRDFIISDSSAWQINDEFKILGGPYSLSTLTGGAVSSSVDSALVDSSCNVGFFQGKNLHWMNFPNRTASTDHTLSELLGTIPTNLCGGNTVCTATAVNFAVCPNNGFCLTSVNLTASNGTIYKQLFLLAPGFNSFFNSTIFPPGIAVLNNQGLNSSYQNYITATYLRSTNRLAFTDTSNNVYFYDPTGKLLSGPTNLFDLFGTCGTTPSSTGGGRYTIYIPYPIYGVSNQSNPYLPQQLPVYSQLPASYDPSLLSGINYVQNQPSSYVAVPSPPAPHTYYDIPKPEPYKQYQTPAPQYQPAPAPQYQPTPAPSYQPAPAPVVPVYQPAPSPQYQPANQYQFAPAPPASYPEYPTPPSPLSYQSTQPAVYATTPAPQYQYQPTPSPPSYVSQPAPNPAYQPASQPASWPSYPTVDVQGPSYQQINNGNQYPIIIAGSSYSAPASTVAPYNAPAPTIGYASPPQYSQPAPAPAQYQPAPQAQYSPSPPPYDAYSKPTPAPMYQPAPQAQYNPSPPTYDSYNKPAPAPVYQPAPQPPYSQPTQAPYQSPSPSYQPAPAPQYQPATTSASYQSTPALVTNAPAYQNPYKPNAYYEDATPAPYSSPSPSGYSSPYQTPYLVPPMDLPMYVPSVPSYNYQPAATTKKPYKVTTTSTTPTTVKKWRTAAPSIVMKITGNDNKMKPDFQPPGHQFFDLSAFVRKGGSFVDSDDNDDTSQSTGNRMVLI